MVVIIGRYDIFGGLICEGTQDRSYALCHAFILTIMVVRSSVCEGQGWIQRTSQVQ